MKILKVKKESYPSRCEICHKSDCFNIESNYCSRCANLLDTVNRENINKNDSFDTITQSITKFCVLTLTFILGIVIGFCIFIFPFSEYGHWPVKNPILSFILFICFLLFPIVLVIFLEIFVYHSYKISSRVKNT